MNKDIPITIANALCLCLYFDNNCSTQRGDYLLVTNRMIGTTATASKYVRSRERGATSLFMKELIIDSVENFIL